MLTFRELCACAVPFKYAQKEVKGIVYILSFGIGVAIVCPRIPHLSFPVLLKLLTSII